MLLEECVKHLVAMVGSLCEYIIDSWLNAVHTVTVLHDNTQTQHTHTMHTCSCEGLQGSYEGYT